MLGLLSGCGCCGHSQSQAGYLAVSESFHSVRAEREIEERNLGGRA